jgi:hypothetical protein
VWRFGASASTGSYLHDLPDGSLPSGKHVADFPHSVVGADAAYSWRHLEIWSELFLSRFEVPNVEDCDSLGYYLEGKTELTQEVFAALRWNQQLYGKVDDGAGRDVPWDRDVWRIDSVLGYRFDRHLQGKLQYSLNRQSGRLQEGEQLVVAQLTLRF